MQMPRMWEILKKFSDFYFSSYGHFSVIFVKISPQFSMITREKKMGEFFYYFSRYIQNIPHHSQSLFDRGHFWGGGGVCVSISRTQPRFALNGIPELPATLFFGIEKCKFFFFFKLDFDFLQNQIFLFF